MTHYTVDSAGKAGIPSSAQINDIVLNDSHIKFTWNNTSYIVNVISDNKIKIGTIDLFKVNENKN